MGHDELLDADTALIRQPGSERPHSVSLRVVIEDTVQAHTLPASGEVSIGRAEDAHVTILHASVSRRHALLAIRGTQIFLSDSGSANGTRLREKLEPQRWTEVRPGDIFTVGDVSGMLYDGAKRERARRGVGQARFAAQLEQHLSHFEESGTPFAVCVVSCVSSVKWADLVHGLLLSGDYMSVLTDAAAALLLVDRTVESARDWAKAAKDQLIRAGARPELKVISCPRDGKTVAELFPVAADLAHAAVTTHRPPPPTASPAMRKLEALVNDVASSPTSILILGETGVGKEVLARALHDKSNRRAAPFLALNCAALSETLLEGELFGYEKGAFTGAVTSKAGLLELAEGGTLFLDELGEMPLSTQAKLLRVLEERTVWRLGAIKPRPMHVRLLTATNRNLPAEIAAGRFRADLYYRINGLAIAIPPLRERTEEILPLADYFAAQAADALQKPMPALTAGAREALLCYSWPGNIRELRNAIERSVLLSRNGVVGVEDLPDEMRGVPKAPRMPRETLEDIPRMIHDDDEDLVESAGPVSNLRTPLRGGAPAAPRPSSGQQPPAPRREPTAPPPSSQPVSSGPASLRDELEGIEKERIAKALEECGGNQTKAAKLLGISRRVLMIRMSKYGVRVERSVR